MKNLYSKLFGTTSTPLPNADIAADFAKLETELAAAAVREKALRKEIAETGVLLTAAKHDRDVEHRINAHLRADNAAQDRRIEALEAKLAKHTRGLSLGTIASAAARKAAAAPVAGVA